MKWSIHKKPDTPQTRKWKTFLRIWYSVEDYCSLLVKSFVICFYLGWSGSVLQIRTNIVNVGSKQISKLNFQNGYLSLMYFCVQPIGNSRKLIFCFFFQANLSLLKFHCHCETFWRSTNIDKWVKAWHAK